MKLSDVGFRVYRIVAKGEVLKTFAALPGKIKRWRSHRSEPAKQVRLVHPFDDEFGTDTSGLILAENLRDSGRKRSIYNTGFTATPPSMFSQALGRLDIDFARFTFVDLGAGKGRIILLASNFFFKQVIGVELIPELHAIAERNIGLYRPPSRQCNDVQCILSDVCDFVFPSAPLVIFMWNPFVGAVFERVMSNLEDSLRKDPREVYLVYLKADLEHIIQRSPSLHKLWESQFTMSDEDHEAYYFAERSESCVAYGTSTI